MLQPTCLASVEVGLYEDVNRRFMISVDVAHIVMQVMLLLHITKVHTHDFVIGYMVMTLSGGELLCCRTPQDVHVETDLHPQQQQKHQWSHQTAK